MKEDSNINDLLPARSGSHSPKIGDDLTILPLYEMYRHVVSAAPIPPNENYRIKPPTYELTPLLLGSLSIMQPDDEPIERFEDSLLPNVHKLRKLGDVNRQKEHQIHIKIVFTEEVVSVGDPIVPIETPTNLKQGDVINGVVIVTNKNSEPIPFETFLVSLEGIVGLEGNTIRVLNMVDLFALWNDAYLNRKLDAIDFGDQNRLCSLPPTIDVDGTEAYFPNTKLIMPNSSYKKVFLFTLPEKLIYCECDLWSVSHMQLPSSLGTSRLAFGHPTRNDFAFPDASITYAVHCLIVCRAQDIDMKIENQPDEYILVAERYSFLSIHAGTYKPFEANREMLDREAMLIYNNLAREVEEIIKQNRDDTIQSNNTPLTNLFSNLLMLANDQSQDISRNSESDQTQTNGSSLQRPALVSTPSHIETEKLKQTYKTSVQDDDKKSASDIYEVYMEYRKKSILGLKVIGLFALSTSRHPIVVKMINYRDPCEIVIPLELNHVWSQGTPFTNPPSFKIVEAELSVVTTKAKDRPLQLLLTHDHVFNNKPQEDSIEYITIRRFQKYALAINKIIKSKGLEALGPDNRRIVTQVKALANLGRKNDLLTFKHCNVRASGLSNNCLLNEVPWEKENLGDQLKFSKKVDIVLNLGDLRLQLYGKNFLLVPSFQNCYIGRLYYITIRIRCPNGDKTQIKIPIVLEREIE